MSIYVQCPRLDHSTDPVTQCEGEVPYIVATDSDDQDTWIYAEPAENGCSEGHILTAAEFDKLAPKADKLANEHHYSYEPN